MNNTLLRWEDIKSFDDLIPSNFREVLSELESQAMISCPFLRREEEFFYYCGKGMPKNITKEVPSPNSVIYKRRQDLGELNIFCRCLGYRNCCYYTGRFTWEV